MIRIFGSLVCISILRTARESGGDVIPATCVELGGSIGWASVGFTFVLNRPAACIFLPLLDSRVSTGLAAIAVIFLSPVPTVLPAADPSAAEFDSVVCPVI